jgi:hypothetical protein
MEKPVKNFVMISHVSLGTTPYRRSKNLQLLISSGQIFFAGNKRLKIYGLLNCNSGKRMKMENRVFFSSAEQAEENGYRPCGHCLKENYKNWQDNNP